MLLVITRAPIKLVLISRLDILSGIPPGTTAVKKGPYFRGANRSPSHLPAWSSFFSTASSARLSSF